MKESEIVAEYRYNAWGNILEEWKDSYDSFAPNNPIRYRSYYYDIETGFYYLQSRYYDPEIGAFISPDTVDYLDPETIGGLNLYAYCNNNPVMGIDPTGHIAFFLITMSIGLAVGTGIALYNDYKDDNSINGSIGASGYVLPILIGGAIGAVAGMAISGALSGSFFTGVKGVFTSAKMVYGMYKAAGLAGAGYMMYDNLKNAFHYTTHVFWSSGELSMNGGSYLSSDVGGTTLEMTKLGQYLTNHNSSYDAWKIASANFANQVPNGATAFAVQNLQGVGLTSTWATTEYPILFKKGVEIVYALLGWL